MNSIYKQLNKIDDNKSLNEKWNVENFRELKKLQEDVKTLDEKNPLIKEIQEYIHDNIFEWNTIGFETDHIYVVFDEDTEDYTIDSCEEELENEFGHACELEFEIEDEKTLLIYVSISDEVDDENYEWFVEQQVDYSLRAKDAQIIERDYGYEFLWISQEDLSEDDAYELAVATNNYLVHLNKIGTSVKGTCYCRSYPEDNYKVQFTVKENLRFSEVEDATVYEYGIIDDSEYFEEEYTTDWNEALKTFNNIAHRVQKRLVDMDDEEYEDYYSDGGVVRMITGKEGSDAWDWDTIREVTVFRDHIENEDELEEQLITEGTTKTYRYPKGSPIVRFGKHAGNTTENFETTEASLAKAKNNIVYKIKQRYNLTGNVNIDPSKLIIIGGNNDSAGASQIKTSQLVKQNDSEQLKLDI